MNEHRARVATIILTFVLASTAAVCAPINFNQVNLVSDLPGMALTQDVNLANPWGIAFGPGSPVWISNNGTGTSTLYNGSGQPFPVATPLVVTIPPPTGSMASATPTGVVFNATTADFGGAHFIFATEDGTISGWTSGTSAVLDVNNSVAGAVYKGLAIAGDNLYAANFNTGNIDVFNSSFAPITVPGGFTDSALPAGYAPFDIKNIGGLLYVTYAQQDAAKHDDVPGSGHGFVDVFNANGTLQQRLISNGPLDSPWGLAVAPASFGSFGGDLLVGNFGDGTINAFNLTNGTFAGTLDGLGGTPLVNPGLWGIEFGDGANGFNANTLYVTAGIPGPNGQIEDHGLFAAVAPVPEPVAIWLTLLGFSLMAVFGRWHRGGSKN
jgi:uncharacterized protein (TIGR03118 family)